MFLDPLSTSIKDLLKGIRQGKLEDVCTIVQQHGLKILTQQFEGKLPLNWALINKCFKCYDYDFALAA